MTSFRFLNITTTMWSGLHVSCYMYVLIVELLKAGLERGILMTHSINFIKIFSQH